MPGRVSATGPPPSWMSLFISGALLPCQHLELSRWKSDICRKCCGGRGMYKTGFLTSKKMLRVHQANLSLRTKFSVVGVRKGLAAHDPWLPASRLRCRNHVFVDIF